MFYRQLAEVSSLIVNHRFEINDVLQLLCLRALTGIEAEALLFAQLDSGGALRTNGSFGLNSNENEGKTIVFTMSERNPITDSIRENKIIWVDNLPAPAKPYSANTFLEFPKYFKTMICSPIEMHGLPMGSLVILSRAKSQYDETMVELVEAISMLFSNALSIQRKDQRVNGASPMNGFAKSELNELTDLSSETFNEPLTERQNLILKLIAEGRTNAAIADVLGYSESLIRQETIRIYAKLGCSGRNEAAQIYLRNQNHEANSLAKTSA